MKAVDNGGANAIKGFNYQKSVIVLIAVLNYLKSKDFQIYVEAEDDIVVSVEKRKTYIQVKSSALSVQKVINRPQDKASIIEKNLASGDEESFYKLVTPSFGHADKNLEEVQPRILREGASVYQYNQSGLSTIRDKLNFNTRFWAAINSRYFDAIEPVARELILKGVWNALNSHSFVPGKARFHLELDKGRGVVRRVPVFEPRDYIVYFYLLKILEPYLAENRVPNTFGGWRMGGYMKRAENAELKPHHYQTTLLLDQSSTPRTAYNKFAWVKYYGEYQAALVVTIKKYAVDPATKNFIAVKFDIANFYDCVRLDILEAKIRDKVPIKLHGTVESLMYFLRELQHGPRLYSNAQTSIPQDALQDCSRILANFYLQEYDQVMRDVALLLGGDYFRYADDQIMILPTKADAQNAIHRASIELSKIGLNLNKAKVNYFGLMELIDHFCYKEFQLLEKNPKDSAVLADVCTRFLNLSGGVRKSSLLKKIIGFDLKQLGTRLRMQILAEALSDDFLTREATAYHFSRIHNMLDDIGRADFLRELDVLVASVQFTSFQFEVLEFYKQLKIPSEHVVTRITDLQSLWK